MNRSLRAGPSDDFEDTFELAVSAPKTAASLQLDFACESELDTCGQGPEADPEPVRTLDANDDAIGTRQLTFHSK